MSEGKISLVPTGAELEVLKVLWQIEPATVRQVHDHICQTHPSAYTTTLKLLQIMYDKDLVIRDASNRAHVYRARFSQSQMQSTMVDDFVSKAFGGSRFDLVVRALGESASTKEIDELKLLLESLKHKDT